MSRYLLEADNLQKHFPLGRGGVGGNRPVVKAVDGVSFKLEEGTSLSMNGVEALIDVSARIRDLPARAVTGPEDYLDLSYLHAAQDSLRSGSRRSA